MIPEFGITLGGSPVYRKALEACREFEEFNRVYHAWSSHTTAVVINDKYDGWRLLLRAHNICNAEDIKEILELLMNQCLCTCNYTIQ